MKCIFTTFSIYNFDFSNLRNESYVINFRIPIKNNKILLLLNNSFSFKHYFQEKLIKYNNYVII